MKERKKQNFTGSEKKENKKANDDTRDTRKKDGKGGMDKKEGIEGREGDAGGEKGRIQLVQQRTASASKGKALSGRVRSCRRVRYVCLCVCVVLSIEERGDTEGGEGE